VSERANGCVVLGGSLVKKGLAGMAGVRIIDGPVGFAFGNRMSRSATAIAAEKIFERPIELSSIV